MRPTVNVSTVDRKQDLTRHTCSACLEPIEGPATKIVELGVARYQHTHYCLDQDRKCATGQAGSISD